MRVPVSTSGWIRTGMEYNKVKLEQLVVRRLLIPARIGLELFDARLVADYLLETGAQFCTRWSV